MNKFILSLVTFLTASMLSFAQEHLTFKNIPIDGTATSFVSKLSKAGFYYFSRNNNGKELYKGLFTGKECYLMFDNSLVSKTVHTIYAIFLPQTDWRELNTDYYNLKKGLTTKYGEPNYEKEEFRDPYIESQENCYDAFKEGHAEYMSTWDTETGTISLYIRDQQERKKLTVVLRYIDAANSKKATEELSADL